jgi:CheY-like chemotaxis protein
MNQLILVVEDDAIMQKMALKILRSRGFSCELAITGREAVAVTAHAMVGDRETAIEAGCAECVTKPYELEELISVVERYIGPAQRQAKIA